MWNNEYQYLLYFFRKLETKGKSTKYVNFVKFTLQLIFKWVKAEKNQIKNMTNNLFLHSLSVLKPSLSVFLTFCVSGTTETAPKVRIDYFVASLLVMTVFVSHCESRRAGRSNRKTYSLGYNYHTKLALGTASMIPET